MPNRIIKESVCTSDTIDLLSWFEEVVFYRLMVNCDDFGRFDGRIAVIKSRLFPLKSTITDKALNDAINKLATVGLVKLYECDSKPILQLITWGKHQQVRAKRSKYPAFDEACNQTISDDGICPRNPIQSNTNTYMSFDIGLDQVDEKKHAESVEEKIVLSEFKNVKLTETERQKLYERFGSKTTDDSIEEFGAWMKSNGKSKKDHYATLLNWIKKKVPQANPPQRKEVDYPDYTGIGLGK